MMLSNQWTVAMETAGDADLRTLCKEQVRMSSLQRQALLGAAQGRESRPCDSCGLEPARCPNPLGSELVLGKAALLHPPVRSLAGLSEAREARVST